MTERPHRTAPQTAPQTAPRPRPPAVELVRERAEVGFEDVPVDGHRERRPAVPGVLFGSVGLSPVGTTANDDRSGGLLSPLEALTAAIVERVLERDEGRHLGPRTVHDHNDGESWAVDLTYDHAVPRVALELTSVQDDRFLRTSSAAEKLARRLTALAEREGLGGWDVILTEAATVRDVEPVLTELIRAGATVDPTDYTSDDLLTWEAEGTLEAQLRQRRQLETLHIQRVERNDRIGSVRLNTFTGFDGGWEGLPDLDEVLAANSEKLAVTGLEGHLAVAVGRYQVDSSPGATAVPVVPPGVDRLWVIRLWHLSSGGYAVWSAGRGSDAWAVHADVMPRDVATSGK